MKWNIKEKYNTMVSDTDSAMKCFALSESKAPEWSKKMIKVWYNVIIGIWLAIASVTFAPISFIFRIVCSFIKHNWFVLLLLAIIVAIIVAIKFYIG